MSIESTYGDHMSIKTDFVNMSIWNPERPYNRLPLLPPGHELETKAVLKQCIKARAAVAEVKQAAELIPNQSVLINTLPEGEQLLTLPILYLSRYIIQNKKDYYRLLLDVTREQAWEAWVLYILRGVEDTATWTGAKIAAIRSLFEKTTDYIRTNLPKVYSHELVSLIFELPYCRISNLTETGIAKRQTASAYLKQLVEIGVLTEITVSKEMLFLHPKLMRLLTTESNDYAPYVKLQNQGC